MTLGDSAVDDPQTLYRLVSSAQPSLSRVGCAIDTSDAFFRRAGISRKIQSVGKQERERLVQLQRECQKAWDVAAECRLILPELRTMAPSCTKAANDGNNELGGTIIEGVGYNTIVDMIPTAETIQHIEENDELISSFRPYLIDALRAERSAKKTSEDAPHPDDTRQLETTLVTFPGNRLIDFEAVNVEAAECQQWAAGSTFTAAIIPEDQLVTFPMGPKAAAHSTRGKSLRSGLRSATPTFRRAQRFHDGNLLPGVRHPELGHYHLRFSQVEPRVVGGYIARQRPPTPETPVVEETFQDIKKVVENPTSSIHGAESVKDFTVSVTCRAPENVYIMRERLPPPKAGSWVFRSKALRSDAGTQSAAKDLEYFPYADVRSTVKRSRCPATFAYTVTERRREAVAAAATVGMYDIVGDIAQNPHRIVCMDRESTREKHWLNKAPPHTMAPDFADVDKAVRAVKQRTRNVLMAPRETEEETMIQQRRRQKEDNSVSIERDLNYPRSIFDRCEAPRVPQFSRMRGRTACVRPTGVPEAPENINLSCVTKRSVAVYINPTTPGHIPLHHPNSGELGDVPNYKWVKPTTERSATVNTGSRPPAITPLMHDLCYDTTKRDLVEPRVVGDPMIEMHVSREKRAQLFNTSGCGAQAVYDVDIPYRCKSIPLFERQITKETQFCGHRLQSERWMRKNPRAPGPGHYKV